MLPRALLVVVCLGACGFLASLGLAAVAEADAQRDAMAQEVAEAWFTSLMSGRTAVATSLSAVPFSVDKKQEVKSLEELKKLFDKLVADKGKRDLKITSVKIISSTPDRVEVALMIGKEGMGVSVKPGEAYRVVGFSD
jgi:hypothetical protein